MRFCPECGERHQGSEHFCPGCGLPMDPVEEALEELEERGELEPVDVPAEGGEEAPVAPTEHEAAEAAHEGETTAEEHEQHQHEEEPGAPDGHAEQERPAEVLEEAPAVTPIVPVPDKVKPSAPWRGGRR